MHRRIYLIDHLRSSEYIYKLWNEADLQLILQDAVVGEPGDHVGQGPAVEEHHLEVAAPPWQRRCRRQVLRKQKKFL